MNKINLVPTDPLTARLSAEVLAAMYKNYLAMNKATAASEFLRPDAASNKCKARNVGVRRKPQFKPGKGEPYTPEEDEVICRYYAGEMTMSECSAQTERTIESISKRAKRLGLWGTWQRPQTTWEWVRRTLENNQLSR